MIYHLDDVYELTLIGVGDRGVPEKERVILKNESKATISLAQFCVCLGVGGASSGARPIQDNFYWLGNMNLGPGTWLFLYTNPGSPTVTTSNIGNEPAVVLHWGRRTVLFSESDVVPILFRLGGVAVEKTIFPTIEGGSSISLPPPSTTPLKK
jgi:hypothetical protein